MLREFINSINFYVITPDRNFFHSISDREYWGSFSEKYLDKIVERYKQITSEPRGELTARLCWRTVRCSCIVAEKSWELTRYVILPRNGAKHRDRQIRFREMLKCIACLKALYVVEKEAKITWNFLTHQKPQWDGTKITLTSENNEKLEITPKGVEFTFMSETVDCDDETMNSRWGDKLYHVLLSARVNKGTVSFEIR